MENHRGAVSRMSQAPGGHGPHKRAACTGHGDHALMGMFAACAELPLAFAQTFLGLTTDVLKRFGALCQASL
jgi:hypothetical protein